MLFEMAVTFPGIPFDQVNKQDYYVRGFQEKNCQDCFKTV